MRRPQRERCRWKPPTRHNWRRPPTMHTLESPFKMAKPSWGPLSHRRKSLSGRSGAPSSAIAGEPGAQTICCAYPEQRPPEQSCRRRLASPFSASHPAGLRLSAVLARPEGFPDCVTLTLDGQRVRAYDDRRYDDIDVPAGMNLLGDELRFDTVERFQFLRSARRIQLFSTTPIDPDQFSVSAARAGIGTRHPVSRHRCWRSPPHRAAGWITSACIARRVAWHPRPAPCCRRTSP